MDAHGGQQLSPPDRVVHHGLVGSLLLPLNRQQGIFSDLGSRISRRIRILKGHEAVLPGRLLQLLVLGALDEIVDSSLSEKIRLSFLARANLAVGGALVHPVDSIDSLLSTRGFKLPLQLFLGALLLDFVDSLLGALALGECLLLFIPDGLLISPQGGMEGLLEVEIAATHDGYVFPRGSVIDGGSAG